MATGEKYKTPRKASDKPMYDTHRKILRSVRKELVNGMNVCEVLLHMAHVFNEWDEKEIKSKSTIHEQCETFLDILPRRGEKAYHSFTEALYEVNQPYLATLLTKEAELTNARQRSAGLEGRVRTLEKEIKVLKNTIGDLRKKKEKTKQQDSSDKMAVSLTTYVTDACEILEEKKQKLAETSRKNSKIMKENAKLNEQVAKLKRDMKELKNKKTRLELEIMDKDDKIRNIVERMSNLKTECDELIEKAKRDFTEKIQQIQGEVREWQIKCRKLEDQLNERTGTFLNRVSLPSTRYGVFYHLKKTPSAKLVAMRSSDGPGKASDVLFDKNTTACGTEEKEHSWWCFDLGEKNLLFITHCALKNRHSDPLLRKWQLQGSTDGRKWTLLKTGEKRLKTDHSFITATWPVESKVTAFRYFRINQISTNSFGKYGIHLSGVELYGVLLDVRQGMNVT